MPQIDAPSSCEHVGTLAVAVGLTVGEIAPVSAIGAAVNDPRLGMTGGGRLSVRARERIVSFVYFLILNSAGSLEICRKIIIAPKILKICV